MKPIIAVSFFAGGVIVGFVPFIVHEFQSHVARQNSEIYDETVTGFILTNPILGCHEFEQGIFGATVIDLQKSIQKVIDKYMSQGDITLASVYFRDLNNGPWVGINESEEFAPASLLKLPLAISFFAEAEDDPEIFSKRVTYVPQADLEEVTQPFLPKEPLVPGETYAVRELIDHMLIESSNAATEMLGNMAGMNKITKIYKALGLEVPVAGADYKITAHNYGSFFRILFNASYLSRRDSELILNTLTKTAFKDALVASVPEKTVVSHKFGSRGLDTLNSRVQLHDCGIIYAPGKPYLLCVMTQGSSFPRLANVIKDVSAVVYTKMMTGAK